MASVHPSRVTRTLLTATGVLAVALAILGIFLPLLPTVPLLLLAAACFARSSERLLRWLLHHPHLGPLVHDYLHSTGIPASAKVKAIGLLWASITLSALLLTSSTALRCLLMVVAIGVTVYLLRLPTR